MSTELSPSDHSALIISDGVTSVLTVSARLAYKSEVSTVPCAGWIIC